MAGIFAPEFQGEVAYERPVQQPSAVESIANLGTFLAKEYGRGTTGSQRSKTVDPNLSVFQQGLERVEAIRDQKGESAALIAERQLAKNFALQDIEFDNDYQTVYKTTTGRPWAGYGRDNQAFMREEALQDPKVQASYQASYAILPRDVTDEDRVEYAISQQATLQASADIIARSKAEAGYKWSVETEGAYGKAIDTFLDTNVGSLVATTQQGGRVGPQALANIQASWSQMKVQISRPSGVSDDQWKSTQAKIGNIDTMLTNLQKASSSDVLFEEITTAMAESLIEEGGGDTTSLLAAMTAIKDPSSLANLAGANVKTFIMDAGKSINLDVTQPDLFGHIAEQAGLGETPRGNITLDSLPPDVESRVKGLTPQQYFDGLTASGQLTKLTTVNSLQRPEGRQQFVENAAGIGAVLMSTENDDFLSPAFLKELVGNPQFIQNLKTLDGVDPEGATVARTYLRSGLVSEIVRQERNLTAIDATSIATWNGTTYVIDPEALKRQVGTYRAEAFTRSMQRHYGGDILVGIRRGFRAVIGDDLTDVVERVGLYNLEGAVERRDAIGVINSTLKAIAVEEPEATETTPDNGEVTTTPVAPTGAEVPAEATGDARIEVQDDARGTGTLGRGEIITTPLPPIGEVMTPEGEAVSIDTTSATGDVFRQGDRDVGPSGPIRAAQTVLSQLGTSVGEVDGIYGRNTMNAVQEAQEMLELPRTGVLDQTTQDRLNNLTDDQIAFFKSETEGMAETEEVTETTEQDEGVTDQATDTPSRNELIDSVFRAEGGYSNDKGDTGNYYNGIFIGTNHGISAPVLAKYLGRTPSVQDMRNLTQDEAREIAATNYYDRYSIELLPEETREIVFHAVYMGGSRGIRAVQNLTGQTPDGQIGPATRRAMRNATFTPAEFRDEYLRELEFGTNGYSGPSATWNRHGRGWTNRYNALAGD